MGHEIAHNVARHSAEKMSFFQILIVLEMAVNIMFDLPRHFAHHLLDLLVTLPFSRAMESEVPYRTVP